jgi:hypothetical protein
MTNKVLYLEEIEISAPLSVVPAGTRIEMSRPKEVIDIGHKPMTDTAKPQKYSKVMPIEVEHEAEDVWQSTGFTPRQLLEQRDELRDALNDVIAMAEVGRVVHVMNRAKAALAKCRKEQKQ